MLSTLKFVVSYLYWFQLLSGIGSYVFAADVTTMYLVFILRRLLDLARKGTF